MNKSTLISVILFAALLICPSERMQAQTSTGNKSNPAKINVSGVVKDEKGSLLLGVTVIVEGTSQGTVTNEKGQFTFSCKGNDKLQFSYVGYTTLTVDVNNRTQVNVTLQEDSKVMDDVIVIGYGTTTRKRTVGAVDQVKSSAISERSMPNMTLALQGTSPSLVIQQRSFDPNGGGVNINIRGIGTMNDNSPLIVIDGMIADGAAFNKLNPQDIENLSVLKDAGSAAIYGSRAANGVLLVTTKKGRVNQAPQVKFNAMVGMQDPHVLYKPVEGYINATLLNNRLMNGGELPKFTPNQIDDLRNKGNGTYFLDQITQTALQQSYNVSVQGGGSRSTYMVSAGYYDQQSNYIGPNLGIKRYNLRTNITTEYKNLKLTGLLSYSREDNTSSTSSGNALSDASRVPTYYYYKMQDPTTGKYLLNDILGQFNPLGMLKDGGVDKNDNDYINLNVGAELKLMEGLKLRGAFGADVFSNHRYTRRLLVNFYDSPESEIARPANSDRDTEDWNEKAWLTNTQAMLDFDRTFGKHHVAALLGVSNESYSRTSNQIRLKLTDPDLGIKGDGTIIDPAGTSVSPESTTRRSISSLFGRVNYDYNDRYYLEASFRYDGSSKFSKDYRWGFFPSISGGWRISQEDFMGSYRDKVGDLKIRASYGTLGNQAIGDYEYFTTYDVYANTYGFNNSPVGGAGFNIGTNNLQWEVSHTLNVGADASFFKGALSVGFDYFTKNTTNILVTPQTPAIFGTTLKRYNAGEMKTQGWELTMNYALKTGDFKHNFTLNLGDSWNKVVKFEGFEQISTNDQIAWIIREGLPLNSYYGLKTAGIFQSYQDIANSALPLGASVSPGDLRYVDRNGDGVIDGDDRYYLGNAFPRYTFGLNYNLEWKGFDLNIFLQGVLKRDMMVRGEMIEPFHANYYHTIFEHQLDYWTPTNTDAKYPQLTSNSGSQVNNFGNSTGSDIYLLDGKYLRLKNLQLGYTLPQSVSKKVGMERVKIYINAQNLFTLSNNSFIDPESSEINGNMGNGGANSGRNYPSLRYYGFGLDITF